MVRTTLEVNACGLKKVQIPTLASCSFDEIVDAAEQNQVQFFQLYVSYIYKHTCFPDRYIDTSTRIGLSLSGSSNMQKNEE